MNDSVQALAADFRRYLRQLESLGVDGILVERGGMPAAPAPPPRAATTPRTGEPAAAEAKPAAEVKPAPAAKPVAEAPPDKQARLAALARKYAACEDCKLCRGRTQVVYGVGHADAELLFVGEGPGADEDAQGIPFVGRAGQLLTRIIVGMGMTRDEVYIANIVKCRPPGNRDPEDDEIDACFPKLREQIDIVRPKAICALGRPAAATLLGTTDGITRLRGQWREYEGIPVMPTYHPSYLLRNPVGAKKLVWEDMQAILRKLGRPLPSR